MVLLEKGPQFDMSHVAMSLYNIKCHFIGCFHVPGTSVVQGWLVRHYIHIINSTNIPVVYTSACSYTMLLCSGVAQKGQLHGH